MYEKNHKKTMSWKDVFFWYKRYAGGAPARRNKFYLVG